MAKSKGKKTSSDKRSSKVKGDKGRSRKAAASRAPKGMKKAAAAALAAPRNRISPLAPAAFPELPRIEGVRFAAVAAGVRYPGRLDVMLAEIAPGAALAGVFTRSATRAAPVLWCEEKLAKAAGATKSKGGYAVVVNSGNANAFTGVAGRSAVEATAAAAAETLGVPRDHVLIASTGVIGEPLPVGRITAKMAALRAALDTGAAERAARSIMTTDTFPKGAAATRVALGNVEVSLAGFAKGSGMIAPDMATMLAFLFTDAVVEPKALQAMLATANAETFNCITVDGDTSTSDSVFLVATGKAQMPPIRSLRDARGRALQKVLTDVMRDLAHQVVRDGEGATKFVEIHVTGAASPAAARNVGLAIANSPLVKTALAGEDPNWGRVVMAVGKSGEKADRDRLAIRLGDIPVAENGQVASGYQEASGADYMKRSELTVGVDLGVGSGAAKVWTCDLTHRYIDINADYRS